MAVAFKVAFSLDIMSCLLVPIKSIYRNAVKSFCVFMYT